MPKTRSAVLAALALVFLPGGARPETGELPQIQLREVTAALFRAPPGTRPDLSGRSLAKLDLADLDFKRADLEGADLYGADLSRAKLAEATLRGARLDRALLTATDFSGADLRGARILRPTVFTSLEVETREAPRFTGANMAGVEIVGWLDRADFRAADLTGAMFGSRGPRDEVQISSHSSLVSCNFSGAVLKEAILAGTKLRYARFINADLRGANLRGADLTQADFTGADLAGADVTAANVDEANLATARGLDTLIGLESAVNRDKALTAAAPPAAPTAP